jgi:hypothetical protein
MGRLLRVASGVAALVAATGALAPGPAAAQTELGCAPDADIETRIEQAPTVFTGTVRALGNKGRTATVDVIRVWKGGTLPRRVQVTGTIATQSKVITALDRLYARERTYLFLPTAGSSPRFAENRCSATRALTAELSARAPEGGGAAPVGEGVPLPDDGLKKAAPLLVAGPAILVLAGLLVLARRKSVRLRRPVPRPGT